MPLKGGSNKACAACKYQRRRCSKDCPLAPYFPADKPKMFSNAHRLFGVSNIMRILKQVEPDDRDEAMKSIIFESDIRARFPVGGCYEVILQYQGMIYKTMEELHYVNTLLTHCKQNYSFQQHALPFFPMDHQQYSQPGTSIEFDPIYNNREASSFDCNLAQSCGESNKEVMIQTPSCTSVITDANAKPELMMSMQVDTSSANYGINDFNYANSMDSIRCAPESSSNTNYYAMKEAKSNLMLTQGLSYIHDDHEQPDLDAGYNIMNVDAKFDLMGKKRASNYINGLETGLENVEIAAQGRPNAETALGSFRIDTRPSCSLGSFGIEALPSCSYRGTKQAIDRISEYDGMAFGGEFVDEGQSLDGHESLVECKDALHVNSGIWIFLKDNFKICIFFFISFLTSGCYFFFCQFFVNVKL